MPKHSFGQAKKVYCIEKNEVYPSITFVKERINPNVWNALEDSEKAVGGFHYRFATPEDELTATIATKQDYPNRRKTKKKVKEEEQPVKRGWTKEEVAKWNKVKNIADSMTNYLNQLESIFTSPMGEQEKIEAFNMAALFVGKLMVSFCDFCEIQEIYVERGARGGKIKPKKEENKEDDYEYEEVDNA